MEIYGHSFPNIFTCQKIFIFRTSRPFEDKYEGTLPTLSAKAIDDWARKEIQKGLFRKGYWNLSKLFNKNKQPT